MRQVFVYFSCFFVLADPFSYQEATHYDILSRIWKLASMKIEMISLTLELYRET